MNCGNCGHSVEDHNPRQPFGQVCLGSDGCECASFRVHTPEDSDPRDGYLESLLTSLGHSLDNLKIAIDTKDTEQVNIQLALSQCIQRAAKRLI